MLSPTKTNPTERKKHMKQYIKKFLAFGLVLCLFMVFIIPDISAEAAWHRYTELRGCVLYRMKYGDKPKNATPVVESTEPSHAWSSYYTSDSSGHTYHNTCSRCGLRGASDGSGGSHSFSGNRCSVCGYRKPTCSHPSDQVHSFNKVYAGNGQHYYDKKCYACNTVIGTHLGPTDCTWTDDGTPCNYVPKGTSSHSFSRRKTCKYCGGSTVVTGYVESCTWGGDGKCIHCTNKKTGTGCHNGICEDSTGKYDPCGCSSSDYGSVGGCALGFSGSWSKDGKTYTVSLTGCAWHKAHCGVPIVDIRTEEYNDCKGGKHQKRVERSAHVEVSCSKCSAHSQDIQGSTSYESVTLGRTVEGDWTDKNSNKHERTIKKKCPLCGVWEETKETASHDTSGAPTVVVAINWTYDDVSHWHVKTATPTCSVCGHKHNSTYKITSQVDFAPHSFTDTYGSWVAKDDGYYWRTKKSTCSVCGFFKTSDERGEKVHTHRWVSTSGSWYDYDSTRHARNNWEYCNGTPTPCGETRSLGNSYESHNSNGQRTDNDLSDWLYDDNHNDRHDDNETHHWKEQQANSKKYCTVCGHIMDVTRLGTTIVQKATHTIVALPSDRSGYRKLGCSVCGYYYYEPIEYTVEFDGNLGVITGNGTTTNTIKYNQTVALPYVTREGYTFVGWQPYSGSTAYTCSTNTDPSNGTVKLP